VLDDLLLAIGVAADHGIEAHLEGLPVREDDQRQLLAQELADQLVEDARHYGHSLALVVLVVVPLVLVLRLWPGRGRADGPGSRLQVLERQYGDVVVGLGA